MDPTRAAPAVEIGPGHTEDPRDPAADRRANRAPTAGEPQTKFSRLTASEANELIEGGKASGGMIPKLQSIVVLLQRGVHSAHIISGAKRNALLSEVFTDKGTGTMIVA
ncbi:MAG TPA: hypothetical protein VJW17_14675 [Pyrinomonadaceae bacterium]|nr:hypothetical protein [Pyrinomonadaceae bacterium]